MNKTNFTEGDIIFLEFSPTKGHEQRGHRPGVIVSNDTYHQKTGMYLVCPISTSNKDFPLHIALEGTKDVKGKIFCEHVRAMDLDARNAKKIEECPPNILESVKNIIQLFLI